MKYASTAYTIRVANVKNCQGKRERENYNFISYTDCLLNINLVWKSQTAKKKKNLGMIGIFYIKDMQL